MYADYFSLKEKPFSITPDPAYLFLSKRHEEALAHLLYGVTDSGGFIQLTGEVGTGKTTIIRSLFERIPENVEIALILNPRMSEGEFLHAICDELLIPVIKQDSNKECFDALNNYLLDAHSQGRKVVLLVDEAQNLAVSVLEYIRLLTNLETEKDKLLQIILVGQPELQTLLQRQDLRQLAQRITARYHLVPLNRAESEAYIQHRLRIAGTNHEIFSRGAKQKIFNASKGIPRLINVLADRALLGAYSQEKSRVDSKLIKQVIKEVLGEDKRLKKDKKTGNSNWKFIFPLIASVGVIGVALGSWLSGNDLLSSFNFANKQNQNIVTTNSVSAETASQEIVDVSNEKTSENIDKIEAVTSTVLASNMVEPEITIKSERTIEVLTQPLSDAISMHVSQTNADSAINNLLSLWGKNSLDSNENLCVNIKTINMRCLYRNSNWESMLRQKRPVILELYDSNEVIHHVVMIGADQNKVKLDINQNEIFVSLEEVVSAWRGDYLMFWQPDRKFLRDTLYYDLSGDDVLWLKEKLQFLNIKPSTNMNDFYFGANTKRQVQAFQQLAGLLADGIVGSETYVAINNQLGLGDRPRLLTEFEGQE